mmetsp:Transcript_105178/g.181748  ORF Transcript_105178/g.181748 Transcript_105178/m.181748 type:complete len:106 (+) Transcript_105178:112-429(+)
MKLCCQTNSTSNDPCNPCWTCFEHQEQPTPLVVVPVKGLEVGAKVDTAAVPALVVVVLVLPKNEFVEDVETLFSSMIKLCHLPWSLHLHRTAPSASPWTSRCLPV